MILIELKHYLSEKKRVSLNELAYHFDTTPEAIRGMLEHWIRKGKIRRAEGACGKSGCHCHLDPATLEIYEWCVPGTV